MRKTLCLLLFILAVAWSARAGGYQVSLHGEKQNGMGLIGTPLHLDGSCLFYNPGGLPFLKTKYSITGGLSLISSSVAFQKDAPSVYQASTDNPMRTPFNFYAAMRITDKFSAGVAVNTPYGNSVKWDDDWAGRYLIRNISLMAVYVQPTVSYKICDKMGIGAGLVYAMGDVKLGKAVPVTGSSGDGKVEIEGTTSAIGFNAGLMIKPLEKLNIGIDYRSKIDMELNSGTAKFTVPASLGTNFPAENKVKATLPMPANLDFGASYEFSDKLMMAFGLNYVFWDVYDSLIFDFETNTSALADSRNPREYSSTLITRIGAQYKVSDKFFARLGCYYDPSPANHDYFTPETPSMNNLAFTCGFSWLPVPKLSIDASFLYIMGLEGDRQYTPDNFAGTYEARFYIPGIGLSYNF